MEKKIPKRINIYPYLHTSICTSMSRSISTYTYIHTHPTHEHPLYFLIEIKRDRLREDNCDWGECVSMYMCVYMDT